MLKVALSAQTAHASDPARVLNGLNHSLCGKFKYHFVTAAYIFVDMEKNIMRYAAGGHPPLLLWHAATASASEIVQNGLLLGMFPQETYSSVEIAVQPGDKAILYTDGILETSSPSDEDYGIGLFKEFLESNHGSGAEIFADSFLGELFGWSEHPRGQGQEDDLTLLVINFPEPLSIHNSQTLVHRELR